MKTRLSSGKSFNTVEEQALYLNQARKMDEADWRGFTTHFLTRLPDVLKVVVSQKMLERLQAILENVDTAKDAVMDAARDSADLIVEAAVEVLQACGEGDGVPAIQTRGLNAEHDAMVAELAAALTVPRLKDEETGRLFED